MQRLTDPLRRRGAQALVKATVKDVYQLDRVMIGMDAAETPNPQLLATMGGELAQAYDLSRIHYPARLIRSSCST